jgi:hypothetical protein
MKRKGEPVTLTWLWWDGPLPAAGDSLRTRTGRRYLILDVRGRRLDCVVLGPDEVITGGIEFEWTWGKRKRGA